MGDDDQVPLLMLMQAELGEEHTLLHMCPAHTVRGLFRFAQGADAAGGLSLLGCSPMQQSADGSGFVELFYPEQSSECALQVQPPMGSTIDLSLPILKGDNTVVVMGTPPPMSVAPTLDASTEPARDADYATVAVEAASGAPAVASNVEYDTTADNLAVFLHDQRTNWPGWLQDLHQAAKLMREFGAAKFYIKNSGGKAYIIFNGNPKATDKAVFGVRKLIRGSRYSTASPVIKQLGITPKSMLRSGAKATVFSFVVVAAIDIVGELMQDEVYLARLGVTLAADATKLVLSMLAGVAVGALIVSGPVWVIGLVVFAVAAGVGLGLDAIDNHLGITKWLQDRAVELTDKFESGLAEFLRQLEWCAERGGRGCFY